MRRAALELAVIFAVAGCGGEPARPVDSGPAPVDAGPPIPAPAAPVLTPCPAGWRELTDANGVVTCDPWPASGYDDHCAFDAMHVPGTPGCTTIGTACAADGWPTDLPTGHPIRYVDDDAPAGGDGLARTTAFRTVGEAVRGAAPSTVVAIATGRYDESVSVGVGVTLWGACVAGTRLTASTDSRTVPVVDLLRTGAAARNLAIDTASRIGVWVDATGELRDVVISGARYVGIYVGASLTADHLAVRDTAQLGASPGYGIFVDMDGSLTLGHAVVERNHLNGVSVNQGHADLSDVAVRSTLGDGTTGELGEGVRIDTGGTATLARVAVENNRLHGLTVGDPLTRVDAADLVVRDTQPTDPSNAGDGVLVRNGATFVATRMLAERNTQSALWVDMAGSRLELDDFVVRDTSPLPGDGQAGFGLEIATDATALCHRGVIDRSSEAGVFVVANATLEATDLLVRDTAEARDFPLGVGVYAQTGAHVTLGASRVVGATFFGIGSLSGSVVTLDGVTVSGVASSACGATTCVPFNGGFALTAHFGGTLTAAHFALDHAALCGAVVGMNGTASGATAMDLAHGTIDDSPVGACVQVDGYDTARLRDDVAYRSVGIPLQATSYGLPAELMLP